MRYSAILFDLDGTLLPMELEPFMNCYFKELATALAPFGLDAKQIYAAVMDGTRAMMLNDGRRTNEEVFWDRFTSLVPCDLSQIKPACDRFYAEGFHNARKATGANPRAVEAVRLAREKADHVVLATNPVFPIGAQIARLSWVDLTLEDFDLVTRYETECFCKPFAGYYNAIFRRIGVTADQCLLIGNDETEDAHAAAAIGMDCFLVTDCRLPDRQGRPWTGPQGSFTDMLDMLRAL